MENEKLAIETAYQEAVAHLTRMRDQYLEDLKTDPERYAGVDIDNAYIWYVESF